MKTAIFRLFSIALLASMLLAACAPAATPTKAPEPTKAAEPTKGCNGSPHQGTRHRCSSLQIQRSPRPGRTGQGRQTAQC